MENANQTPTISIIQAEISAEFAAIPEKDQKYQYLLQLARKLPALEESIKDEKFLVKGCATRLFLIPNLDAGKLQLQIDTGEGAESPLIVRGLAFLAWRLYHNQPLADVLQSDPTFFQSIGLNVALSATRANGFASLLKQIFLYARVYQATQKS
jgi:cysteine desulfuration protein SufE